MKYIRLQLVKHAVAAIVFLGVCTIAIQVSVLTIDIPLDALGVPDKKDHYFRWITASKAILILSLAFYLSRKTLSRFDQLLVKRKSTTNSNP